MTGILLPHAFVSGELKLEYNGNIKLHVDADFLYLCEVSEISKKLDSFKNIQSFKLSFSYFQSNKTFIHLSFL